MVGRKAGRLEGEEEGGEEGEEVGLVRGTRGVGRGEDAAVAAVVGARPRRSCLACRYVCLNINKT